MNSLVIYDSQYGNTERVAQAIGRALSASGEAQVVRVDEVSPGRLTGLELLVVGSPTQRFRPTPAITGWLRSIPANGLGGAGVAAFDTRIPVAEAGSVLLGLFVRLAGPGAYAAQHISEGLTKGGGRLVALPEGFLVRGTEGPLKEGELERAARWATGLRAEVPSKSNVR